MDKIFSYNIGGSLSFANVLSIFGITLVIGILISLVYIFTHKKTGFAQDFLLTIVMLPTIVGVLVMLIGGGIGYAISLGGAFTMIRFRTTLRDTKDLSYLLFAIVCGFAAGLGYIFYAIFFAVLLCLVMVILEVTKFGISRKKTLTVKVTVPESLNYQGLFDEILNKYATSWYMKRVKTVDFGALFEVSYRISVDDTLDQKAFVDEIRTLNGNLPVQITMYEYDVTTD